MKTYKETIRREAFGVVAGYMSGGYGGPERQVVHCIAQRWMPISKNSWIAPNLCGKPRVLAAAIE